MLTPSEILTVNYHYCIPPGRTEWRGFKGVTPDALERQIAAIKTKYAFLDLAALPYSGQISAAGGLGCLVTFDDGMADIAQLAMPILERHGVPAIIFCCALPYVEGKVLNVQKSHLLQGLWGWNGFRERFMAALANDPEGEVREDSTYLQIDRMYRYDDDATGSFKRLLNVDLPYRVVDRILDRMFEHEFGSQREAVAQLYLSLDDIKRCVDKGLSIGLHTYAHRMSSRLSRQEQTDDIDASLELFRDRLGLDIQSISYPYGVKGTWDDNSKQIAVERGLNYGFTLGRELFRPALHKDLMEIPRFDVNDIFEHDGGLKAEFR
ncbi:MAG: polysaccharide deacetylase family protein [Ferrovibrio sp.]|uniref:polysaccharide deacetylase family protein n=1 Tax=Ferrovibrio sp. TaxID=1917215 RepID=UPI003919CB7D